MGHAIYPSCYNSTSKFRMPSKHAGVEIFGAYGSAIITFNDGTVQSGKVIRRKHQASGNITVIAIAFDGALSFFNGKEIAQYTRLGIATLPHFNVSSVYENGVRIW